VRLAFLGTGSAFSLERYNGAVVVNARLLLDAGAPLLPHMHRLGIDPLGIDVVFLTHFHGDHVLGLPPFLLYRGTFAGPPLHVVGPPGTDKKLEKLCVLVWGDDWRGFRERIDLRYREAEPAGEVAGVRYEAVRLDHGAQDCRGYRLHLDGGVLAYAGDTTATPPLDDLVRDAAVAITEATSEHRNAVHTSWEEAAELAARHPRTRFLFNHVFASRPPNAVEDLQVVDV
jgi:ribonuclease BN (tRNA processing enzyme)